MLRLFVHPVPAPGHITLWGGGHVISLPEDTTTHSQHTQVSMAATIQVAGCHFLVKSDLVQPELAVLAVCP